MFEFEIFKVAMNVLMLLKNGSICFPLYLNHTISTILLDTILHALILCLFLSPGNARTAKTSSRDLLHAKKLCMNGKQWEIILQKIWLLHGICPGLGKVFKILTMTGPFSESSKESTQNKLNYRNLH